MPSRSAPSRSSAGLRHEALRASHRQALPLLDCQEKSPSCFGVHACRQPRPCQHLVDQSIAGGEPVAPGLWSCIEVIWQPIMTQERTWWRCGVSLSSATVVTRRRAAWRKPRLTLGLWATVGALDGGGCAAEPGPTALRLPKRPSYRAGGISQPLISRWLVPIWVDWRQETSVAERHLANAPLPMPSVRLCRAARQAAGATASCS